jgi:hypothetical protein
MSLLVDQGNFEVKMSKKKKTTMKDINYINEHIFVGVLIDKKKKSFFFT